MPTALSLRILQWLDPPLSTNWREIGPPAGHATAVLIFNPNTLQPDFALLGTGLVYNGGSLSVALVEHPHVEDSATNAPVALDGGSITLAALTDELNTANANYNDLATKFNTLLDALEANGILAP